MKNTARHLGTFVLASFALAGHAHATIFGVKTCGSDPQCGSVPSGAPAELFSFQEDGSLFMDLGTVQLSGQSIDVDGLAHSPTHGLMGFELQSDGSRLIAINPTTAEATAIGPLLSSRDIRGAVFDTTGVLWALDAAADVVVQVDPLTGTLLGTPTSLAFGGTPFNLTNGSDIAVRHDGTFFVSDSSRIFTLDVGSGGLTLLHTETAVEPGTMPGANPFYAGLAFATSSGSSNLFAYEVNGFDDLYTYDNNFNRALFSGNILSSFNAGRGDLASAAVPEPASIMLLSTSLAVLLAWRTHQREH